MVMPGTGVGASKERPGGGSGGTHCGLGTREGQGLGRSTCPTSEFDSQNPHKGGRSELTPESSDFLMYAIPCAHTCHTRK